MKIIVIIIIIPTRRITKLVVVPQILMNIEVEPIYDSSSKLREVKVSWINQVCRIIIENSY